MRSRLKQRRDKVEAIGGDDLPTDNKLTIDGCDRLF